MLRRGAKQMLVLTQADELIKTLEEAKTRSRSPLVKKALKQAEKLKEEIREIRW